MPCNRSSAREGHDDHERTSADTRLASRVQSSVLRSARTAVTASRRALCGCPAGEKTPPNRGGRGPAAGLAPCRTRLLAPSAAAHTPPWRTGNRSDKLVDSVLSVVATKIRGSQGGPCLTSTVGRIYEG